VRQCEAFIVRLSGGSRAVAAATVATAGGCRVVEDDVEGDDSGGDCASCCAGVARPVA